MLKRIVFASTNKGKIREVKQLFSNISVEVVPVPEPFEVIEDGATFLDNALIKARNAASLMNEVALADDSGLMVDALDGKPGVHSSRYAEGDSAKINKLLNALNNVPEEKRSARFICSMVLVSPSGEILYSTSGVCEGKIIFEPKGSDGFGFDPVFLVPELNLTMAQIPLEKKNTLSHRARALRQMLDWISDNN
jgi:XTP/dITP diphosphohydrolase